jgi:hypothetical protein
MALDPSIFDGAKLKVQRANRHIDELQSELAAFANGGFYAIRVDPHDGRQRITVATIKPLPERLPLIIGDAVHNLRAALDHLATAASRVAGGKGKDLFFPFHKERKNLVSDHSKLDPIESALPGSKRLITDNIQPCEDGNGRDLYALHSLDKIDKHNDLLLTATGALVGRMTIRYVERGGEGREGRLTFENCIFNLDQALHLARVPDSEVFIEQDYKASLDVRFGQTLPLGKELVVPTLVQLSQRVGETIELFVALCR